MSSRSAEGGSGAVRSRRLLGHLSIGARLAIFYTLSAFCMLAAVVAVQYGILIRGLEWEENQLVVDKIKMFEATLREHGDNRAFLDHEVNLEGGVYWPGQEYVVYSRILDEAGRVVIETPGMETLIPPASFPPPVSSDRKLDGKVVNYGEATNGHSYFLLSAWAWSGGEGGPRRLIQVAMDESGERSMIAQYRRETILALLLGTLFIAFAGTFIAYRCLRPVQDLAKTAQRVTTANDVMTGIDPDISRWPRELRTLAESLYRMLSRLESSYTRCAQSAEDMAHELRNPIHNLMGEAEVALSRERTPAEYRRVLESSLEEYDRLTRMINRLMFIARADDPHTAIEPTPLEVCAELNAVREFHEAQAQEQGITISCSGHAALVADAMLLRRAVSNLVANALSHTPAGGRISLEVCAMGREEAVEIIVRDTGCGISAEKLPRIVDRYYSAERGSPQQGEGAGLGLAIVRSIMSLHGGSVAIDSAQGKGTTVVLCFPARPAPDGTSEVTSTLKPVKTG